MTASLLLASLLTLLPAEAGEGYAVTYRAEDPSVVTVDENGQPMEEFYSDEMDENHNIQSFLC